MLCFLFLSYLANNFLESSTSAYSRTDSEIQSRNETENHSTTKDNLPTTKTNTSSTDIKEDDSNTGDSTFSFTTTSHQYVTANDVSTAEISHMTSDTTEIPPGWLTAVLFSHYKIAI